MYERDQGNHPDSGAARATTGEMTVRQSDYDAAQVGDEGIIVYDPLRPRRSVLYKYSQYAVRDMYGYQVPA